MIYDKNKINRKIDNDVLNINSLGNKIERNISNTFNLNYNRLNSLDKKIKLEHFSRNKILIISETIRLLNALNLPINLKFEVIKLSLKANKILKKHQFYKSAIFIVPAIIYIVCQKNFIFLKLTKLSKLINFSREILLKCIRNCLKIELDTYKLIHSEKHRKKKIVNFCYGFINMKNLNVSLLEIINYLNEYWHDLKNIKDNLICILILVLISKNHIFKRKDFSKTLLCKYFGISFSSFRNHYNKLILKEII